MMTTLLSGLSAGALYGVIGLFNTIPLVRCGMFNFAIAFVVVLGSYITVDLVNAHWSTFEILLFLLAVGAILGAAQEILTVRPLRGGDVLAFITPVGVAIMIQGFIIAYWGPNPASISFFGGDHSLTVLGGRVQPVDLTLIGIAIFGGGVLQFAVAGTRWGMLGRAAMSDQTAAKLRGVNILRMRTGAFALASALACAAALVAGPKTGVDYEGGLHLVVFSFAAMAVGGYGSFTGAVAGGFFIGLVEAFTSRYASVDDAAVLVFGILCAMLLIRPKGLFGSRHIRLV